MAENTQEAKENPQTTSEQKSEAKRVKANTLWWGILSVYLLLFVVTGYLAFGLRDVNPALSQGTDQLAAKINDEQTKTLVLATLQQEAADHKKKDDLAAQSFNIVLGSLLGFLSASAVRKETEKPES